MQRQGLPGMNRGLQSPSGFEVPPQMHMGDMNPMMGQEMPRTNLPPIATSLDMINKQKMQDQAQKQPYPMMGPMGQNGNQMTQNPGVLNKGPIGAGMQPRPPSLNKQEQRKQGRKPTPSGEKKSIQPKSPAPKKAKEVTYVRLLIVQQQYRVDSKIVEDINEEVETEVQPPPIQEEVEAVVEEDVKEEEAEQVPEEVVEAQPEEPEEIDERGEEDHEEYQESQEDDDESQTDLYDQNDVREISVNSKNKTTSLKKIILESIGLYKKANIDLLKKVKKENPEGGHFNEMIWVPFSDDDYNLQVKSFQDQTIAFKVSINIDVCIDGRGQSYKSNLTVDPMEKLDSCLKSKTHFWKTFMMRGNHKCLVAVTNKNEEDTIVAPDFFKQSFKEIGVSHGTQITLHEFKNLEQYSDAGEEGEEENEEMEEEQEENNENHENNENGEEVAEIIDQAPVEAEVAKKASEVLFENEGEQKTADGREGGQ